MFWAPLSILSVGASGKADSLMRAIFRMSSNSWCVVPDGRFIRTHDGMVYSKRQSATGAQQDRPGSMATMAHDLSHGAGPLSRRAASGRSILSPQTQKKEPRQQRLAHVFSLKQ
jgi:hypothetical protein